MLRNDKSCFDLGKFKPSSYGDDIPKQEKVFKEVHDEFHEEIDSESLMRWEARKDDKREHDNLEGHLKLFLANYY